MEKSITFMFKIVFPLLIAVSLLVGISIPVFYDWTGADQSRPAPVVLPFAGGLLIGVIVACSILPWLSASEDISEPRTKTQFNIRTGLLMTAAVGILFGALNVAPKAIVGGILLVASVGFLGWFAKRYRSSRLKVASLVACMYLPFIWIISWRLFSMEMAVMATGLPSFFPSLIVGSLFGETVRDATWLLMVLTSGEILFGLWMIHLGTRRTIAYLLFALLASTYGSFILNAMVRA